MANPVLVEALRGSAVESMHRGSLVVRDAKGRVLLALGDQRRPTFARSAVKLLQALPLVASGAADHFALSPAALALACASHNGEPMHTHVAASVLESLGLNDRALECGAHAPYLPSAHAALAASGQVPCALHNNCSGKHAGFAALGAFRGLQAGHTTPEATRTYLQGYVHPSHAVMREVGLALQATTDTDLQTVPVGIDGCSIPTYAIALDALALAFARVATGEDLSDEHARAALRLRRAIATHPEMVGGTDRFDTLVMQALGERVCCKVGAEGVYCAALPERGLGIALKMDDGNTARAAEVVMAALIESLVTLSGDERDFVRTRRDVALRNWQGVDVGRLRASRVVLDTLQLPGL
jgi:L-asparaginase II